jgi:hypothetical protein
MNNCSTNCLQCSAINSSVCQICYPGYGLLADGRCIRCLTNCTGRCDPYNIVNCIECGDGY